MVSKADFSVAPFLFLWTMVYMQPSSCVQRGLMTNTFRLRMQFTIFPSCSTYPGEAQPGTRCITPFSAHSHPPELWQTLAYILANMFLKGLTRATHVEENLQECSGSVLKIFVNFQPRTFQSYLRIYVSVTHHLHIQGLLDVYIR